MVSIMQSHLLRYKSHVPVHASKFSKLEQVTILTMFLIW